MTSKLRKPSRLHGSVLPAVAAAALNRSTAQALAQHSSTSIITTLVEAHTTGSAPYAMSRNLNGDLLIPCNQSHTVYSIEADSNVVTTVAGTGTYGHAGDGGLATLAKLRSPTFAMPDSMGNILVGGDATIRRIDASTGVISTVVGRDFVYTNSGDGGSPLVATLGEPAAAVFTNKKLYFVDSSYGVIRFVDFAGDFIDLTAGTGTNAPYNGENIAALTANLCIPSGIVVDGAGNIYVTVTGHHIIRKITLDGKINTIAGIPKCAGFSGDGGSALAANLSAPKGLAMDDAGDLYFSDRGNYRVRKISKAGIISTVLCNGTNADHGDGLSSEFTAVQAPAGVFIDNDGALLVSTADGAVRRILSLALTLAPMTNKPVQNQFFTLMATLGTAERNNPDNLQTRR